MTSGSCVCPTNSAIDANGKCNCNSGYYLDVNARACVNPCPTHYFANTGSGRCEACDITCVECSGSGVS